MLVLAVTLSTLFVFKQEEVSRLFLVLLFVTQPIVTLGGPHVPSVWVRRDATPRLQHPLHARRRHGTLAQAFADRVEARPSLGIRVVGHLAVPGDPGAPSRGRCSGRSQDIQAVFHARVIDEVAVCLPDAAAANRSRSPGWLRMRARPFGSLLDHHRGPAAELHAGGVRWLRRSLAGPRRPARAGTRRETVDRRDRSAVGLVVLSPVLLVNRARPSPSRRANILFRQTRVGLNGRPFTIYKFRTMVPDAEALLGDVAHLNTLRGHAFKATNDPRITASVISSSLQPGRTAPALERPQRGDEPRGSAPAAPPRGGASTTCGTGAG